MRADLLLLLVTLLAAAGWIFSRETLAGLPPLLFIGTRFLLAGSLLAVFAMRALRRLSAHGLATARAIDTQVRQTTLICRIMRAAPP